MREAGLNTEKITFSKPSVSAIINGYTRESGLRGLEKKIATICRKLARKHAEEGDLSENLSRKIRLTPTLVHKHLGAERFGDQFYHQKAQVGVSLGLAYTQVGGEVMAIESTLIPTDKHRFVLTGKLGDVMKESAQAALCYIRSKIETFGLNPSVIDNHELHVHVPAGAVPKDGPSAGIAIATSILSGLMGVEPKERVAMTGEITIHGKVLAIGGVREKLLAAQREGMSEVIIPEKNRNNYSELPASLKRSLKVHFVSDYNEVFEVLFENANNSGVAFRTVTDSVDKGLAS